MYLLVRGAIELTLDVSSKAIGGAINAFEPRIYYFLYGYETPFKSTAVNIHASTSAPVEYKYNADIKQFNDLSEYTLTRYLPLLSLDIVRDDSVVYDLTDFIESMTVTSDVSDFRFPSVAQIVAAWAIGSQVVFDKNIDFKARCMSDMGERYEFNVSDTVDIYKAIEEADKYYAEKDTASDVTQVVAQEEVQEKVPDVPEKVLEVPDVSEVPEKVPEKVPETQVPEVPASETPI